MTWFLLWCVTMVAWVIMLRTNVALRRALRWHIDMLADERGNSTQEQRDRLYGRPPQ